MTRDKLTNILWGIILIAAGILIGGKVAGLIDFSFFFPGWWTLFLIVPCTLGIVRNGFGLFNCGGLLLGVLFLLQANGVIYSDTIKKMFIPAVFLIIGVVIIFNSLCRGFRHRYKGEKNFSATFAGNNIRYDLNQEFTGCTTDAVFGGIEINLRDASITEDAVIDATAVFGGIEIMVPNGVNVKLNRTSLFGGSSSKVRNVSGQPTIYVNALSMFGGVEIK